MIFIGIDISIDSTSVCIEKNDEKILYNYNNNKPTYKWNKILMDDVIFRFISYNYKKEEERNHISKLKEFDSVTDIILNDIIDEVGEEDVLVGIENFNYGLSNTNIIVDIVEFSTLLKQKIINKISDNILMLSPKSIKLKTCEIAYEYKYSESKTKGVSRNSEGLAGGSFDKGEMMKALVDSGINSPIKNTIEYHYDDILSKDGKKVKKPFDDIIDSIWICEIIKLMI